MSSIPFETMMRGPAAVAAWLAEREANDTRRGKRLVQTQLDVLKACGIDAEHVDVLTAETLAMALGACAQVAVLVAFVGKGGMRGPARDALAEIIDDCFEIVDEAEQTSPGLAAVIAKMRASK